MTRSFTLGSLWSQPERLQSYELSQAILLPLQFFCPCDRFEHGFRFVHAFQIFPARIGIGHDACPRLQISLSVFKTIDRIAMQLSCDPSKPK